MNVVQCLVCGKPLMHRVEQALDEGINRLGFCIVEVEPCPVCKTKEGQPQEAAPASGTRARGVGGEKIDEKESPFSKYVRERVNTPGDDVFVEFSGSPRTDCQDCGVDWPTEERRFGQWRPHAPGCPALLQRSKEEVNDAS